MVAFRALSGHFRGRVNRFGRTSAPVADGAAISGEKCRVRLIASRPVTVLPAPLRELIEAGPMAHLTTINADGSPQVSVVWIGLDGDDVVSGHLGHYLKLRNMERDPRVALSFDAPRASGVFMNEYAVLRARATVEPSDRAWDLLDRLAKVYVTPDTTFPAPRGPGWIVRYAVERISGVGPWAPAT